MANRYDTIVTGTNEALPQKKGHNIFSKVISVVLAFILWFYVMAVESPVNEEVFRGIPIEVVLPHNTDLSLYSGYNVTVDVTVSGKRSELNQISVSDFKAKVDASDRTQAGKYSIPIDIEVPGNFNIVDKSLSLLTVHLDAKATTTVPLHIKLTDYTIDEGLELGGEREMEKSVSEVILEGPQTVLDTIVTAQATIPCGNVRSSVRASSGIELLNADGDVVNNPYVFANVDNVIVRIPVFMTKEIDLGVEFKHKLLNSSNSKLSVSPEKIKVRGPVESVATLEKQIVATIDEKSLDQENHLTVSLTLPEGVSCTDGTQSVDVGITHVGTTTKSYSVSNINVKNPKGLKYSLTSDSVNVTMRGKGTELARLTADDISLTIDLSDVEESSGSLTLPVTVEITDDDFKSVYEVNEYKMVVTVK